VAVFLPSVAALQGHDTLIWSPDITLEENSKGYVAFSNFFSLDRDRVIWENIWSERKVDQPLRNDTIFLLNITTGTTRAIAHAPGPDHLWSLFPPFTISGDIIAYTDLGISDLFIYNITEGKEYRFTRDGSLDSLDETRGNGNPFLDGDRIVWSKKKPYTKGYDYDIVMENLTTGEFREICTAQGDQIDPRISGSRIVWTDRRNESGGSGGDIYLYDLATGKEIPVNMRAGLQQQPDISGDTVVWTDYRDGEPAIYLYNLETKAENRISNLLTHAYRPLTDGDVVVWSEYSSLDRRDEPLVWIEVYDLHTGTLEPLNTTASNPGLQDLDTGRILYFTDTGDHARKDGYLHLYVLDSPQGRDTVNTGSISSVPGQETNVTSPAPGGQLPEDALPVTPSAPGFAPYLAGAALVTTAGLYSGRRTKV